MNDEQLLKDVLLWHDYYLKKRRDLGVIPTEKNLRTVILKRFPAMSSDLYGDLMRMVKERDELRKN